MRYFATLKRNLFDTTQNKKHALNNNQTIKNVTENCKNFFAFLMSTSSFMYENQRPQGSKRVCHSFCSFQDDAF